MSLKKFVGRAALMVAAATAMLVPTTTAAHAGDYTVCPEEYVCAWVDRDFTGPMKQMKYDNPSWNWTQSSCGSGTWMNCASSVYNHGKNCDVWLWSGTNYTGQALYLYKTSRLAFLNSNPGPSPVGSWEDIIKSNHWCSSR
ncbi:peptidase inhibitor family I36 protein [Catellatospora sp. KI3]|uniref:peptidase inhibitor family I36 protein n=1 Tax=Catellatospora sp. KI3 TaxID=3041620 RepID=UPI002482A805|nr:peptidase inhibitor family I36 protein [Catellatospora sp. KI3]MDI1461183.1 peptidase inhibitor family I36 protein [Catellatospora sp. KI3]